MPDLKLARLPDRTPIKFTLSILPELHHALQAYAALYVAAYGSEETIADLIPAILASFLESDRAFAKTRNKLS